MEQLPYSSDSGKHERRFQLHQGWGMLVSGGLGLIAILSLLIMNPQAIFSASGTFLLVYVATGLMFFIATVTGALTLRSLYRTSVS